MKLRSVAAPDFYGWCLILLAAVTVILWLMPVPAMQSLPISVAGTPDVTPVPAVQIDDMHEVNARPPFSQTRRPLPAPPAHAAAAPPPAPTATTAGMVLLGVLNTGAQSVALVTLPGQPRPLLVTVGDGLGDWKVIKIKTDGILLRAGSLTSELTFATPAQSFTPASATQPPFSPGNFPSLPSPFPGPPPTP